MSELRKEYYPFADRDLPTGWVEVSVGEIVSDMKAGFSSGAHNNAGVGIPHLRPMSVTSDGKVTLEDVRYISPHSGSLRLGPGDILFTNTSSTAWVGKTAVVKNPQDWAFSNHMTRIRLREGLSPDFFAAQLHFLCRCGYFAHHCKEHVNQSSIAPSVLAYSVPIRVPPAAEQRRIVIALESIETQIEESRVNLEEIPSDLRQTRQSLLNAAFSGLLTKQWRGRRKWAASRKVSDVCVSTFYGPRFGAKDYVKRGGIPMVRTTDFTAEGSVNLESAPHVVVADDKLDQFLLHDGDILITRTGSVGRVALFNGTEQAIHSAYLIRVRLTESIVPRYAYHFFCSPAAQEQMRAATTVFVQSNINAAAITNLIMPVPAIKEQHEIIRRLDSDFERLLAGENAYTEAIANLKQFRQTIFARAFRGALVPQNAAEESAERFLERTRFIPKPMIEKQPHKRRLTPEQSLRVAIEGISGPVFTFSELREHCQLDYETLRDELFTILQQPGAIIKQDFDKKTRRLRFMKVKK